MRVLRLGVALGGTIPIVVGTYLNTMAISGAAGVATLTAVLRTVVAQESPALPYVAGADGIASVMLVLACLMSLRVHQAIVGVLRILWIIVLVTSSSSHQYIRTLFPDKLSVVPNDLTIITIGIAILGFILSLVFARLNTCQHARDFRATGVEILFALGALSLRFDDEIYEYTTILVETLIWYATEWTAAVLAIYILKTPRGAPTQRRVVTHPEAHPEAHPDDAS